MKLLPKFLVAISILFSCNQDNNPTSELDKEVNPITEENFNSTDRQLNVSILWDLSDRIDPLTHPATPQHFERDIEIIKTSISYFKKDMEKRGAFKAKGKIRVFFTPTPNDPRINTIAKNMSCDLSSYNGEGANKKKKEMYDSIESLFSRNANEIYQITLANNKGKKTWDGSDIWRFFKNDVKEYCVDPSGKYRNILLILTDGYIFHKDSKDKQGNRTAYLLPEMLRPFRNNSKWQDIFNNGDYGLITIQKDLNDLEVLVLEISPSNQHKNDEDIIKAYLGKWFEEMGVQKSKYACYNTDLPEYTRNRILKFLSN